MPILDRLKNIFSGGSGDGKKKLKQFPYIKRGVDPNELWEIVGELGDGAFGKVYKTVHKENKQFAALKQVDIKDETELEEYSVEIDILTQCKHRCIVGLYEAYYFANKLWMFIEFCGGGAIDSIMVDLEKPLTEPQIRFVCREMCEALDFLHQHFVIHRDIKAGNVLLTSDGEVRLADFGVSAKNTSSRQKRDSFIGTPYWMAPEVIVCETFKDAPYNYKADIWSLGVTLIEFAQIEPPNHEMHPMRVLMKIQKSDPPTLKGNWSAEFKDFLSRCLNKDPELRPSAADLLQHSFLKNVSSNATIIELLSEASAEVFFEEKDLDDAELDFESDNLTDTDTQDTFSNSSTSKTSIGGIDFPTSNISAALTANTPAMQQSKNVDRDEPSTVQPKPPIDPVPTSSKAAEILDHAGDVVGKEHDEDSKLTYDDADIDDIIDQDDNLLDDRMELPVVSDEKVEAPDFNHPSRAADDEGSFTSSHSLNSFEVIKLSDTVVNDVPSEPTRPNHEASTDVCDLSQPVFHSNVISVVDHIDVAIEDEGIHSAAGAGESPSSNIVHERCTNDSNNEPVCVDNVTIEECKHDVKNDDDSVSNLLAEESNVSEGQYSVAPVLPTDTHSRKTVVVAIQDIENVSEGSSLAVTLPAISEEVSAKLKDNEANSGLSVISICVDNDDRIQDGGMLNHGDGVGRLSDADTDDDMSCLEMSTRIVESAILEALRELARSDTEIMVTDKSDLTDVCGENIVHSTTIEPVKEDAKKESNGVKESVNVSVTSDGNISMAVESESRTKKLDDQSATSVCKDKSSRVPEKGADLAKENIDEVDCSHVQEYSLQSDEELALKFLDDVIMTQRELIGGTDSFEIHDEDDVVSKKDADLKNIGETVCLAHTDIAVDLVGNNSGKKNHSAGSNVSDNNIHADSQVAYILEDHISTNVTDVIREPDGIATSPVSDNSAMVTEVVVMPKGPSSGSTAVNSVTPSNSVLTANTLVVSGIDMPPSSCLVDGSSKSADEQVTVPVSGKATVTEASKNAVAVESPETIPSDAGVSKVAAEGGGGVVMRYKPNKPKPPDVLTMPADDAKDASPSDDAKKQQYRTLTKIRKFVVNGTVMTSQTSRIVATGRENKKQQDHELWKADLRELRLLQKQENRQLAAMENKILLAHEEQNKRLEQDQQVLEKSYENELEQLTKQNKQLQDKMYTSQAADCKFTQKKVKAEQDRDLKAFHESLKQDMKLMKQGVDMLPKELRKDALQKRKEEKEAELAEKERLFLDQQRENLDKVMRRLGDQHLEKVALHDKQFLQQKHQLLRARGEALIELEERHMHERRRLAEIQLKNKFILMRHLLMQRNAKEIEQIKRINANAEDELLQRHSLEKKRLPKILKADTKTRALMFRESLRISVISTSNEPEKDKIKKFEEMEKARVKQETLRLAMKHEKQLEELRTKNDTTFKELEQVHAEKQKMLIDREIAKMAEVQLAYESEMEIWKNGLPAQRQTMEDEFAEECTELDRRYNSGVGGSESERLSSSSTSRGLSSASPSLVRRSIVGAKSGASVRNSSLV